MDFRGALCLVLVTYGCQLVLAQQPMCDEDDYDIRYTSCDDAGERWKLHLPKENRNCANTPAPEKAPKCEKTCDSGKYLDIHGDHTCKTCGAGTYSFGGGVSYSMFEKVPSDFTFSTEPSILSNRTCSQEGEWQAINNELVAHVEDCSLHLSRQVELVKAGDLIIKYYNSYTLTEVIPFIEVKDLCNELDTARHGRPRLNLLGSRDNSVENEFKMSLNAGKSLITLRVDNATGAGHGPNIQMKKFSITYISISGMEYTDHCNNCSAGYYSSDGSSKCTPCDPNTYSDTQAANTCKPCPAGEYSTIAASKCKEKKACTESDYTETLELCHDGKTKRIYSWVEPSYCNTEDDASVKLPLPSEQLDCPSCNPGKYLNATDGVCVFCPEKTYNDGTMTTCAACPLTTQAVSSLTVTRFDPMPAEITMTCMEQETGAEVCDVKNSWKRVEGHLEPSADINDAQFAVLIVKTEEGLKDTSVDPRTEVYGQVTIDLELICVTGDPCIFMVMMLFKSRKNSKSEMIQKSTPRTQLVYNITYHDLDRVTIAFRKSERTLPESSSKNTAKIYGITVTNTVLGGATNCTKCDLGGGDSGCNSCSLDEVIITLEGGIKKCKKCPAGQIVHNSYSCKKCGEGLVPHSDGTRCVSDCQYQDQKGLKFNLTKIAGAHSVTGGQIFTGDGTEYFPKFMFTLCSNNTKSTSNNAVSQLSTNRNSKRSYQYIKQNEDTVLCVSNMTDVSAWENSAVESLVCRETILPSQITISVQPNSLGDELISVTSNDEHEKTILKSAGVEIKDNSVTLHYTYSINQPSANTNCEVRNTTITLICDQQETEREISLPPKCPSGTCDGCHYMIVWRTSEVCPICADDLYKTVFEECVNGQQKVHYIPEFDYCLSRPDPGTVQSCSLLTLPVKIIILCAVLFAVILIITTVVCWRRSKTLQYKYMKLVAGAQGMDGELPAAETCALDSSDEDDVAFKKGEKLFSKIKSEKEQKSFENMKLVGVNLSEI